jgi:hypothetical protein
MATAGCQVLKPGSDDFLSQHNRMMETGASSEPATSG